MIRHIITCLRRSILAVYYAVLKGSFEISHGLCILNHVLIHQGLCVSFFFTEIDCLLSFSHIQDGQFRDIYLSFYSLISKRRH